MRIIYRINALLPNFESSAGRLLQKGWFYVALVLLAAVGFWITQALSLELKIASSGSSPLHWIYLALDPEKSLIDWPTGTRNLGKSLPMHFYRIFDEYLDADLLFLMKVYMAVEILAMLICYYYFARSTTSERGYGLAIIFALIVSLTAFQSMNLARFGYPFVWGLYYSLASAARILGLAFVFNGKPWSAMTAFAVGVLIHPLMGLIGVLAGLTVICSRGRRAILEYLIPAIVLGLITLAWLWFSLGNDEMASGGIPHSQWYSLTKTFNYHWYPFYAGVFDSLSPRYWLPFLSLFLLYIFIRFDRAANNPQADELHTVIIVLSLTTGIGLLISLFELSPFLIKLSLHRSSDLLIVVSFIPVLQRLYADISNTSLLIRVLSVALVLSPVLDARLPGLPIGVSLIYTATFFPRLMGTCSALQKTILVFTWGISLFFLCRYFIGIEVETLLSIFESKQVKEGIVKYGQILILVSAFVLLLRNYSRVSMLVILMYLSISIVSVNHERVSRLSGDRAKAWYETQLWVRDNTPETSLFMLDPAHYGGWRDVSRRASFGSVKEWLHNAWLYDSDYDLYKEGIRRVELFGVNLNELYQIKSKKDRLQSVNTDIRLWFYNAPSNWYEEIILNEGIDFLVFERKYINHDFPTLRIVYENKYFAVYALRQLDSDLETIL